MLHHGEGLPLGFKTGDDFLGVHPGFDDFERDAAADRLFLVGHVNDAAAAFANLLEQLVVADAFADLDGGGRDLDGVGGLRGGGVEERVRAFVGLEQLLDAAAQAGFAGAGGVEVGVAMGWRQGEGLGKNCFFAIGFHDGREFIFH